VKYNELKKFFILFSGSHLQVRVIGGFSRLMAQTTQTRARVCLLGVLLILLSILGVKFPPPKKNPIFGREQAKLA